MFPFGYLYKCFGCKSSWPISNNNISSIVSHFSTKWSNNFFDEIHSPKKHIGKFYDQHQAILKLNTSPKCSDAKVDIIITLITLIRCRKCKLYFPGSLEERGDKSTPLHLLIEHTNICHVNVVNEWQHHQRLSIKSLR